ncbi:L,D-transpeptidase [Bermanella sp. 47_1433_sub80_T6]|nr:L,D-transpeptidase [Bermanella sp. 47_1433_sub80_T6]
MRSLHINISEQTLSLLDDDQVIKRFSISSALNGIGQSEGSGQTPLGRHYIRAKIGEGMKLNTVFVGRRNTGEIYDAKLAAQHPSRDWILTRILWLCGEEVGFNRLGKVDSMARYIYIHGTPDTEPMGEARSHGCIRMRNSDVLTLFNWVPAGCPVMIVQ